MLPYGAWPELSGYQTHRNAAVARLSAASCSSRGPRGGDFFLGKE